MNRQKSKRFKKPLYIGQMKIAKLTSEKETIKRKAQKEMQGYQMNKKG
jgi:hypothetical protein